METDELLDIVMEWKRLADVADVPAVRIMCRKHGLDTLAALQQIRDQHHHRILGGKTM